MTQNTNEQLLDFIARAPSPFHAVASLRKEMEAAGYQPLSEADAWEIRPGGKYCVTRNGSSLIAFSVPAGESHGFMMCAAHSDSPTFKIKENAESESAGMYVRLNTERYGGMLCATWLDRPLSVAGRLVVREADGRITTRLVDVPRDLLLIPNVAIHMMRNANDGMSYNAAVDMLPLLGSGAAKGKFREIVAEAAGVSPEAVLASDLFLYNRARGTVWGAENEFLSAPRLDDLQCAFAAAKGLLSSTPGESVALLAVLDNEEVGSQTKQGAASTFLGDVLARVCDALDMDYRRAIARSFLVSADNAHAVHPNHPELADGGHRPKMNGGIVLKHNANQRYTTDAISQAIFSSVCAAADVPLQYFANRSDMAGGSTLGNIANTHVSLNTVDIGLAQLAMHSSYETAGAADTDMMIRAMTHFYSTSLSMLADGQYELK